MKKILFAVVTFCGIWFSVQSMQTNSAAAQTGAFTTMIIPLTNQVPFTNTVVAQTNLSAIQLSDVVTVLLTLQTNIEKTLPVLDLIQSNAFVASIVPAASFPKSVVSSNSNANSTGVQSSLAVKIGANTFSIDAPTLQALFILRDNLQRSLVKLQALNGTTPPATNSPLTPTSLILPPSITNLSPPVTTFSPGPLTNNLNVPLTNMISPNGPSPF